MNIDIKELLSEYKHVRMMLMKLLVLAEESNTLQHYPDEYKDYYYKWKELYNLSQQQTKGN